ncbi:MAG: P63C domain-containing protein [Thermoleophilaceae bacterium]
MSKTTSKAAKELSKKGAAKGGRARANVLTENERKEIARRASEARWGKRRHEAEPEDVQDDEPEGEEQKPSMPHSLFRGSLPMGEVTFDCHVLSNHSRVLTAGEVVRVLTGRTSRPGSLNQYLERIPGYRPEALEGRRIQFQVPGVPNPAIGYEATLLVEICEMYLDARAAGTLKKSQLKLAATAEIIVRSCAKVGIIALVDEATGYQKVREQNALRLKLQAFIADDMQEWAKMFPDEFWYELARLEGVRYSPRNRPLRWGKYVMAFVYDTIDGDVGQELRRINPGPHYKKNHHQWLRQHGKEAVQRQIGSVIAIMKLCDDMPEFRRKFEKVFSKQHQPMLEGIDWSD